MPSHNKGPKVIFRDARGRFVAYSKRYQPGIALVQARRGGRYVDVGEKTPTPDELATVLSRTEFEKLPEATIKLRGYKSSAKYKLWDIANKIDKTKGLRRKAIKIIVSVQDGKRLRKVTVYHKIKRNTSSSYSIFRRINEEMGFEGVFLYNSVNGKMLSDRKGKQVKLIGIEVEQVI